MDNNSYDNNEKKGKRERRELSPQGHLIIDVYLY